MPNPQDDLSPRMGPRPLALHLWWAMMGTAIWRSAWPMLRNGSLPWSPALKSEADALSRALQSVDPEAFDRALDAELRRRTDGFLTGLERYRNHGYRRDLPDPPTIFSEGNTRLLDYGVETGGGAPVLVVPSLVNRGYVLDLTRDRSLMRYLARSGIRPMLVDWGHPEDDELGLTLTDYVAGRLERILDAATRRAAAPVALIGYCMGGLLAVALALRNPDRVTALALLATPWDFHADTGGPPPLLDVLREPMAAMIRSIGFMPVDALQAMFFSLDPTQSWVKFRRFAAAEPSSDSEHLFVALEDWANDGVPLAAPVAIECLVGWYVENAPARNLWRVAGEPMAPHRLACPALVVVPSRDRIVPPATARFLAGAIPGVETLLPPAGHIGMVVGSRAAETVWTPLKDWLLRHA